MKDVRLHEGELNVMELLWFNKSLAAKDIAKIIKEYIGWEKNTTYTVIKRLIDKGVVIREDPGFICKATITQQAVQQILQGLIDMVGFAAQNTCDKLVEFLDGSVGADGKILVHDPSEHGVV